MTTTRLCTALLALAAASSPGCKRKQAPPVEEVWDEPADEDGAETLGALAPAWPRPTRATLDNGLVMFWLHEHDTPAFNLRLLLPTGELEPETTAVASEYLRNEIGRRGRTLGLEVALANAPGRVELTVRGAAGDAAKILGLVRTAVGPSPSGPRIDQVRRLVGARLPQTTSDDVAIATLVTHLLGTDRERIDRDRLTSTTRAKLVEGWETLRDPRRAVMIVHTSHPPAADAREALRDLSEAWRGVGRRELEPSVVARIHTPPTAPAREPRHLLGDRGEPMLVASAGRVGQPVVVIGRVIPTPSAERRSMARLAQRLAQEQLDARLMVVGNRAVFIVRVAIDGRRPEQRLSGAVELLTELSGTRHQTQRLFQAAQLWLGARIVEASLTGEDWTSLWSESIDLAEKDAHIRGALARDARSMLQLEPDALATWQKRWLDPRAGEPGWRWVVAGASQSTLRKLERLTKLTIPKG